MSNLLTINIFLIIYSISGYQVLTLPSLRDDPQYRLPNTSRPFHYNLFLTIDVENGTFEGFVKINLAVIEETNSVAINFKDIEINRDNVTFLNNELVSFESTSMFFDNETEVATFSFDNLPVGDYELSLEFTGNIRTDLKGLYLSSYFSNGEKRNIATTFFAPNYARMAFPCYDEPEYKATFTIQVTHKENFHALSNMPIVDKSEPNFDGWVQTSFNKSLETSTYIVAFIVSDFVANRNEFNNFSIYAQPDVLDDTNYALGYAQTVLATMEHYIDGKFQYPKLDMIAIDDFLMGAMENWGLITYLSSRVLYNANTNRKQLQFLSKTIAHELAHQWFGNEVSHHWWSAVWLKEGFASLFEDVIANIVHPDWRIMDQFVVNTMQTVMLQDSSKDVRSMIIDTNTLEKIRNIYDFVTYKKAASVMRMMQNIITPVIFQIACQEYIKSHSFNVVTPDQLAESWQLAVDKYGVSLDMPEIQRIFSSWTTNPGFPYVTVVRNYTDKTAAIIQLRFVASHNITEESRFYIPINFATASYPDFLDTSATHWLSSTGERVPIDAEENEWVIANKQATGYYRVNYDTANWELIINELTVGKLEKIIYSNRAQLIDDAMNLARYGHLSYDIALDLINYLHRETDYIPILSALNNFKELERSLRSQDTQIKKFIVESIKHLYEDVRMIASVADDHVRKLLRTDIAMFACKYGMTLCLNDAEQMLSKIKEGSIDPDIRPAVFCAIMKTASSVATNYEELLNRLVNITSSAENQRKHDKEINEIFEGFGCTEDEGIQERLLNMTLNGYEGITFEKTYKSKLFTSVVGESYSGTMNGLTFLRVNFDEIVTQYDSMIKVFTALGSNIVSEELQVSLTDIVDNGKISNPDVIKAAKEASELAADNVYWVSIRLKFVKTWLEKKYPIDPDSSSSLIVNYVLYLTTLSMVFLVNFPN